MFDIILLRANIRLKTGYSIIVDVPGHDFRWFWEIQPSINHSSYFEWLERGAALGSGAGTEVLVVNLPVLDAPGLLFDRDPGRA